jgi:UDP-N-acetylmuramoyl-L-alanyl-D-glutamate--2,6-diaminopimelate ligase
MMKPNLNQLLAHLVPDVPEALAERVVTDIFLDSRKVTSGSLFVALKGLAADGRRYIHQASDAGASVVLRQADAPSEHGDVAWFGDTAVISSWGLDKQLGILASRFYQIEKTALTIIGVTGTNGKSTVTHLMASLSEQLGRPAAVMGTLGNGRPGQLELSVNTTADIFTIHRQLAAYAEQGVELVAMEVSSHGLDQGRVAGVPFKAAVFSNLTRDHLDYHGTMAVYGAAKSQLFDWPNLSHRVINIDDAFGGELIARYPNALSCSTQTHAADWYIKPQGMSAVGCEAELIEGGVTQSLTSPLLGRFNLDNLVAAIATLSCLGLNKQALVRAAANVKAVPGRMELFGRSPSVVVDYAHTPDALAKALEGMRAHCNGKLICVFGCGGDRDQGKRPMMAKVAEQLADHVIVTDDNPRGESAERIVQDILAGMTKPALAQVVHSRRGAIEKALEMAGQDDMILVAGKGHENYQIVGDQKLAFDERAVVSELVNAFVRGVPC